MRYEVTIVEIKIRQNSIKMLIRDKTGICCAFFSLHEMLIKQYNPCAGVKLFFCLCNGDTKGRCVIQTKIALRKLVFSNANLDRASKI